MHRRYPPCHSTRSPPPSSKRIRCSHPPTTHFPHSIHYNHSSHRLRFRLREQWKELAYYTHTQHPHHRKLPNSFSPKRLATSHQSTATYGPIRSSLFRHVTSYVLQRLHHNLYLHRRIHRCFHFQLAEYWSYWVGQSLVCLREERLTRLQKREHKCE